MEKKFGLRKLIAMSVLTALTIVCVRFLAFDTGIVRISFGFVPISVAGMAFGPLGGGIVAVLADILGMLINGKGGVYFFPFTISEFLYGFGYGLILYKKRPSLLKLSILVSVQFLTIYLFVTTFWLYLYNIMITGNPKTFYVLFTNRIIPALVSLPVRVIVIDLLQKYLAPRLPKFNL